MKKYIYVISFCLLINCEIAKAIVYIDAPGQTIVQSTPITTPSNPVVVDVDYYTPVSPGTHLILTSGGSTFDDMRVYHYGNLTISGGSVGVSLWMYDNSSLDFASGQVGGYIRISNNSRFTMSGGRIASSWMGVFDNGRAEISGGSFGDFQVTNNALVTLKGSNFTIGGQSVDGLLNIPQLVNNGLLTAFSYPEYNNVQYKGVLSGMLLDGRVFNSNISITRFTNGSGNTANIFLVPEPCTLLLLGLGAMIVIKKR